MLFPCFLRTEKKIAWCSDRGTTIMGEINVFVADWIGPGRVENVRQLKLWGE